VLREILAGIMAGVGLGSIYAIIAVGYALILGASGVFNFAQGAVLTAGALIAFGIGTVENLPIVVMVAVVAAAGGITGLISHTIAVLPMTHRSGVENLTFGTFLSTLGVGLAFTAVMNQTFGVNTYTPNNYVSIQGIQLGALTIKPIYLVTLGSVILVVIVMELVLRRTRAGLVMRAVFNDVEGASLSVISVSRVIRRVFIVGGLLAALAGFLILPITAAKTTIGNQYAFYGFASMAVGGFGSLKGSVVGGLLVGVVSQVPLVWINPNYSSVLVYALLLAVLIARPQGLFGSGGSAFGAAGLREV